MKHLILAFLILIPISLVSQESFYQDENYIEAKNYFLKGDHKKFKVKVFSEISKPNYPNIFIDLINKIIVDIDPGFENKLTAKQRSIAEFSRKIKRLHDQKRYFEIYTLYKNCDFLESLSPTTFWHITSGVDNISYDDFKKLIDLSLKVNGEHYRVAWNIGTLSNSIGLGYELWSEIESNPFYNNYPNLKKYAIHLKKYNPNVSLTDWESYSKLYGTKEYIKNTKEDAMAYRKLGHLYKALNKYEKATTAYLKSYDIDPFYADGVSQKDAINCMLLLEKDVEANLLIEKFIETNFPSSNKEIKILEISSEILSTAGDKTKSREKLAKILKINPKNEVALTQFAQIEKDANRLKIALKYYNRLAKSSLRNDLNNYNNYIIILKDLELYEELTNEWQIFIEENKIGNENIYNKFYNYFSSVDEKETALDMINRGINLYPLSAWSLRNRTELKIDIKDYSSAEIDLRKSLKIQPNSQWALNKFIELTKLNSKDVQIELQKLFNSYPYSYTILNELKKLKPENEQINFLKNFDSQKELIKERNIMIHLSGKELLNYIKSKISNSKTSLDSLFFVNIDIIESNNLVKKIKLSKEKLEEKNVLANKYLSLGGSKRLYHESKATFFRALNNNEKSIIEIDQAIKSDRDNSHLLEQSIRYYNNHNKGFIELTKSLNRNPFNPKKVKSYMQLNTLYGGSNINAINAYEKCLENFTEVDCPQQYYTRALENLGDPLSKMIGYKKRTNLGTSNRYINWYNSTRNKSFDANKEVTYDKKENQVTIINQDGEITIQKDDPISGKPILKQKGNIWIKYDYTKSGYLKEIKTSSNKNIKLKYDIENNITSLESNSNEALTFKYNKNKKPIEIVLNKKDTLNIKYDENSEIDKVTSNAGSKTSFKITQIFQKLLSLTKSFDMNDIDVEDIEKSELKEKYEDVIYSFESESFPYSLKSNHINIQKKYVEYLANNLSNNSDYANEILSISFNLFKYLESDINLSIKEELIEFSLYYYNILNKIRRLGVANEYWNNWTEILDILEREKLKQNKLNNYRKKIENLQSKFRDNPIELLSSAEWLPKSSLNNNAYWTSTNLDKVYNDYDFAKTPANHIFRRENGDILIAFDNGIALKRNGFWRFLYYDSLNKKLIQNPDLLKFKSKSKFNYFTETYNNELIVNTNSGTFIINNNYNNLTKIRIDDDTYLGNNNCKLISVDSHLYLYNSNGINVLANDEDGFKLVHNINYPDKDLKKLKILHNENLLTASFIALTDKGIQLFNYDSSHEKLDKNYIITENNIKDFDVMYGWDEEIYFIKKNKLFKYNIKIKIPPQEIYGNIILNKEILGLSKFPVEKGESVLGIITDIGINLYKDNHFEFFKIDSKSGLDQFTNLFYTNEVSEFGILTQQKILKFSLEDYFYSDISAKKIKHLKEKKITLMLNDGTLYYSNNDEILDNYIETDGWGSSITDFDITNNNHVYLSDYKTVTKVIFETVTNQQNNLYNVENIFTVDPFQPKNFDKTNEGIKKIKIAKDGTIWATTELSVFRYNKNKSPVLKEFNYFKNKDEFPAKSLEVFNLIETYDGNIMVVNSDERWNDYEGVKLDGGLVIYNSDKDKFEFLKNKKNTPNFPWFITSYTNLSNNEAILGTTSGFAYHSKGGIKSYRDQENKSYLDIEKKYKNLFLGTEGIKFGDFFLFGCGEGVIAYRGNQWFYPERLNQLLPEFSKYGNLGGNKVNAIEVDHLQRLNIATDLGLLIINSNKIDPYDLLLMNRDINKTIEYYNIGKLQKEREKLISELPTNSNSKRIANEVTTLKDKIKELEKTKISFAKDFKLNKTDFKTINIDSVDNQINRITKQHSSLLLTLKEKNPVIYQTLKIPPLSIAGIRNKLNKDECIVQYVPLKNKLIIQVVTKEKLILKEVEVSKNELYNLSLVASDLLSNNGLSRGSIPTSTEESDKTIQLDEVLEQLYNNLISPIYSDIKPFKDKVQIISEGALNYLPFESLIYKDGKNKIHYALENFKFIYLSSLYLLQLLQEFPELENNNYLLVGDPDGSLPHAKNEVKEIHEKFADNSTLLINNDAKIKTFIKLSKNKGIIHLATHGFVDKQTIKDSWLLFSDSKLKLSEVYELNLDETELMVLSACETGFGKNGIETTTLGRAFTNSGVQNLIVSLWKVNDESTKILMTKFYDNLKNGNSYLNALHNAQLYLITYDNGKFKDPKYWSPFILIGKP